MAFPSFAATCSSPLSTCTGRQVVSKRARDGFTDGSNAARDDIQNGNPFNPVCDPNGIHTSDGQHTTIYCNSWNKGYTSTWNQLYHPPSQQPVQNVGPIIGVFLNLGLALYLLITQPLSWGITALWILIGFALYRMYTFKREIEHYAPLVTSEGDLTRKEYRILILYTPDNPDRLIKYAIRVAKEKDGEVDVLRVLTVPDQTPLSAGIAFADAARKSFEPLEKMLEQENILNHCLFRISHETTEAVLATIEEQKIDLVITDFEIYRNNRALQTLATCDVLAIRTTGDDITLFEFSDESERANLSRKSIQGIKKNMVVLYDDRGDHSGLVLRATSWLEHSGKFNVSVLAVNKKHEVNPTRETEEFENLIAEDSKRKEYLEQVGVEFNEIYLSEETGKSSEKSANLILSAVNASQPDLVVTGATVGKFSFFNNSHFLSLLDQLNYPIVIARQFTFPGVHRVKAWLLKFIRTIEIKNR